MTFFQFVLFAVRCVCSLVSGLLLAFAIVAMPRIANWNVESLEQNQGGGVGEPSER
jgi:hypothetical protein